jgi:outer membrane protein assembly factor BamB
MKIPVLLLSLFVFSLDSLCADSWAAWRGDGLGSGRVPGDAFPIEWGKQANVRWRITLPEAGNSTPAVFGEKVYVTQPVTADKTRNLMCFDQKDGTLIWKKGLVYEPAERTHRTNPFCSASPAIDKAGVVVSFGSAGVVTYDHDGKQLWHRDLGAIDHVWGNSSSPVLFGDLVIHYHGPAKNAVLYGLDRKTGATVWEWKEPEWKPTSRTDGFQEKSEDGVIGSFSTPILVETGERTELIMSFPLEMKAFDPVTGKVLWTCQGLSPLIYTSPVYDDGVVVAMGGYSGNSIGVKVGGEGDVTESHRLWHEVRHNGGIGSGVASEGKLYYQNSGGIVYCDDMKTGKTLWKDRLPGAGKSWGSFVIAGDRIFSLSQAGDTVVFAADPTGFKLIAQSDLGEETNSSLAVAGGDVFIRTHSALWCIGKGK